MLEEGVHYRVMYSELYDWQNTQPDAPSAVGDYTATVEAIDGGGYVDFVSWIRFSIKNATSIGDANLTVEPVTYTGFDGNLNLDVRESDTGDRLREGDDFEVTGYLDSEGNTLGSAPVSVGEYSVILEGRGFYKGKVALPFEIVPAQVSGCMVSDIPKWLEYTGEQLRPEPTVMYYGRVLEKGADYTVSYGSNTDVGQPGTLKIVGKGNFSGELDLSFGIYPKQIVEPEAKAGLVYNGSEQAGVAPSDEYSVAGGSASSAGDYTATVSLKDKNNYAWADATDPDDPKVGWGSDDLEVEWSIAKADSPYATPGPISATEGQTLGDLELPEGFSWQDDPSTSVGEAGEHEFMATFTPEDAANYNVVENVPVTVSVSKAADGWEVCGTCMWRFDGGGKLVIKPIDGESGELAEWGDDGVAPWEEEHFWQQRAGVSEIVVEGHVLAPVNAHGAFSGFPGVEAIDLSGLDTSRTTNMMQMFACSNAKAIDVSSFDTSNVTNMSWMFFKCDNLESLDLSSFDTSKVSDAWGWIGSPDERWSLREITLGDKFDFKGNGDMKGSSTGREPLESHTFGGIMTPKLVVDKVDTSPYTGNWVSVGTGESYSFRDELPSNTAATYRAQRKLLESDFSVNVSNAVYSGEAVVGRVKSDSLNEGTDYDVAYSDNVDAGTVDISITGKGFYTGTLNYTFKINPANITADMVSGVPAKMEATGEQLTPEPTVTFNGKALVEGSDYTVSYGDNKEPGKGAVTVAAVEPGNFTGSATVEFDIEKKAESENPDPGTGGGGTDPGTGGGSGGGTDPAPTPDPGQGGGSGGGAPVPAPEPQQFAITYHLDGGVNAASNPAAFAAGTAVALAAPTREGYEFQGWFADSKFTKRVDGISADASGDVELWAKWAKKAPAPTFPDVDYSESSWYGKAVTYVAERGLITGYTAGEKAGQFGVGDSLTRAQLATILWRNACPEEAASYDPASAKDETGIAGSADGQYYTAAANWAVANGVVSGYDRPDGAKDFAADGDVTFEQLVTILARLCATPEELASAGSNLSAFADGGDASSWSRTAFAWAAGKGLVEGYDTDSGKCLAPGENVARERVAVVLMRAFEMGILK